jgi:hypothetical protein
MYIKTRKFILAQITFFSPFCFSWGKTVFETLSYDKFLLDRSDPWKLWISAGFTFFFIAKSMLIFPKYKG